MIINREYIPFRELILNHDKAGTLFTELCKEAYPEDMWTEAYLELSDYALYQREMSWAFRRIQQLIEGFQKLDEEDPYDTGYEIEDARTADILCSGEGTMTLLLRTGADNGNRIVGIMEVKT